MAFFSELEQNISQFVWRQKRPQIAKEILRQKNGVRVINLSDFRLYYKQSSRQYGTGTHTHTHKQKRPMEQDRKSRNKSTHLWASLTKKIRIYSGERSLFNKWFWESKRMKLEHFLTPYTKTN